MAEHEDEFAPKAGDTAECAHCGQPILFRFPDSHTKGFWTHTEGANRYGGESFGSRCDLSATPLSDRFPTAGTQ